MKRLVVAITLFLPTAALAQQQQQQPPTSETAIQIDNIINGWAQLIEAQKKIIAELQKENAELKAKAAGQSNQHN